MSDDLVRRLREAHASSPQRVFGSNIFEEAADAIEAKDAENERLREAAKGQLVVVNAACARAEQAERALVEAVEVVRGMIGHSCVADAGQDCKCEEDEAAERAARQFVKEHGKP